MKFKESSNAYLLNKSKLGMNAEMSAFGHTHRWNLKLMPTPFQLTVLHCYADGSNPYNIIH